MSDKPVYRIAFISPYVPNLIRVRPYNFIRALAKMGHKISLFVLVSNAEEAADLASLEPITQEIISVPLPRWRPLLNAARAVINPFPLQVLHSDSPQLRHILREKATPQHFDVVHIEHMRGAIFEQAIQDVPVVYDAVDSISLLWEKTRKQATRWQNRLMAQLDLKRTQRFEGRASQTFNQILITSAEDKAEFVRLTGRDLPNVHIVPNGVDLETFTLPQNIRRAPETIVFTGKMSYHANIAAALFLAQEIMPLLWQKRPTAKLNIVGKDPVKEIIALAENPNITVTGAVPSMVPYLQQASLAVAPLKYAVGIQNKVLEAMACGAPVIASSQIQHALSAQAGEDFLAADSAEDFAQAINRLLSEPELAHNLSINGRRFVENHHSWEASAQKVVNAYAQAIVPS